MVIFTCFSRREVEQLVARRAHNPKVEGSNPSLATIFKSRWKHRIFSLLNIVGRCSSAG